MKSSNNNSTPELPNDMVFEIFSFLAAPDLTTCSLVSKAYQKQADNEHLWKALISKDFPDASSTQSKASTSPKAQYISLFKQKNALKKIEKVPFNDFQQTGYQGYKSFLGGGMI